MALPDSLVERLFYYAEQDPNREAVVTTEVTISYSRLARLVQAQAKKLRDLGISADSVAGIKCADDIQHLLLSLAAIRLGATSCTIPTFEPEKNQQAIIQRSGVTHIVDSSTAIKSHSLNDYQAPEEKQIADSAKTARLLFSTSGTTGEPKLVIHYDSDLVKQAHRHIGSQQERFLCLASMEHNFVKRHRLYCLAAGATNVFIGDQRESLVERCKSLRVNVLHLSAFQAQELLAMPHIDDLSNVRLKLGGSHVPLTLRKQLREAITQQLQAGYGTTETGAISFTQPDDPDAGESVGQPLPGMEVRILSRENKILGPGERGELAIRCAGMFRGYLGMERLTAERLKDGWFHTGDTGYLDESGRIHLSGRADDMFVFNSINIYPQDIESRIRQYPGVSDALVVGKPSQIHGRIPVAFVAFEPGVKPDLLGLKMFVQERTGIRCPRLFTIVDEIPRYASGKIARNARLQTMVQAVQIRSAIIRGLDEQTLSRFRNSRIVAFEKGKKDITLHQLGLDSLARMNLLVNLEVEFGIIITPLQFDGFRSLEDVVAHVLESQVRVDSAANTLVVPRETDKIVPDPSGHAPYLARFFQRTIRYCHTVAQLNNALLTFEHRLTPAEVASLREWHSQDRLIPHTDTLFQTIVSGWLENLNRMMAASGKPTPEPFQACRIRPTVTHFTGPGSPAEKTLVICFAQSGGRRLLMPNAVLLQHTDANRYDLLLIAEPFNLGYRYGVPTLGDDAMQVVEWVTNLDLIRQYRALRTLGCSAGGYPAVIAGHTVGAEMAVSVGGRFHAERYVFRILDRVINTWKGARKGSCARVLMCYGADKGRDRNYARIMAMLTGGSLLGVGFTDEPMGHYVLNRLADRGALQPFFARTIFASLDQDPIKSEISNLVLELPEDRLRTVTQFS